MPLIHYRCKRDNTKAVEANYHVPLSAHISRYRHTQSVK
jgi:hypothetical protein